MIFLLPFLQIIRKYWLLVVAMGLISFGWWIGSLADTAGEKRRIEKEIESNEVHQTIINAQSQTFEETYAELNEQIYVLKQNLRGAHDSTYTCAISNSQLLILTSATTTR